MELKEVIKKRHTVRQFAQRPVSQEILEQSIEMGFLAPSYNHLREWDVLVIENAEAKCKMVACENLTGEIDADTLDFLNGLDEVGRRMYEEAIPLQKSMLLDASTGPYL